MKGPLKKSKQRIEQDLARNVIADSKSGNEKAAKYEKTKEIEVAAGETPYRMMEKSPVKLESASQERKNLMNDMPVDKRAAAKMMDSPNKLTGKDSAMKMAGKSPMKMADKSPMKMGGSWMSKHSGLKMMKPSPTKLYKKKK